MKCACTFDGAFGMPRDDSFVGAWVDGELVGAIFGVLDSPSMVCRGPFVVGLLMVGSRSGSVCRASVSALSTNWRRGRRLGLRRCSLLQLDMRRSPEALHILILDCSSPEQVGPPGGRRTPKQVSTLHNAGANRSSWLNGVAIALVHKHFLASSSSTTTSVGCGRGITVSSLPYWTPSSRSRTGGRPTQIESFLWRHCCRGERRSYRQNGPSAR